jgi:hypothetical protein
MRPIYIKVVSTLLCASLFLHANFVFAQSDSTNLPGLSANMQTTPVTSSGTGVPNPAALDAVTTYTETEVEPCPSGYYPNGPVPTDGTDVAAENVTGGVIYDQTVTVDRYGTTTYGGWNEVNFLCTQIPPAPTCPTGETEVSAPYWDSTTNQWVGIVCQMPVTAATQQAACTTVWNNYYNAALTSDIQLFGNAYLNYWSNHILPSTPYTGPTNENGISAWQTAITNYENIGWIYEGTFAYSGTLPDSSTNNDVIYNTQDYACFLQPNTNNVIGLGGTSWCSPNGGAVSCGGGGVGN